MLLKLNVGCGWNVLPDWINIDINPRLPGVIPVDLTAGIPFPSGMFDYVFLEHVLEHIPRAEGIAHLQDCFRVLKPGGVLRVATPDLNFLTGLLNDPTPLMLEYIEWSTRKFIPDEPEPNAVAVVNNFFRAWGHEFIYDKELLRKTLIEIGFEEPIECQVSKSADLNLEGLENVGRMPRGYLALESIVYEARRPLRTTDGDADI